LAFFTAMKIQAKISQPRRSLFAYNYRFIGWLTGSFINYWLLIPIHNTFYLNTNLTNSMQLSPT